MSNQPVIFTTEAERLVTAVLREILHAPAGGALHTATVVRYPRSIHVGAANETAYAVIEVDGQEYTLELQRNP